MVTGSVVYLWPVTKTERLSPPQPLAPALIDAPPLPPPLSSVFLPVSLSITAIRDHLEQKVPLVLEGTQDDPVHHKAVLDDSLHWVARRGPIDVRGMDGKLRLGVQAAGDATVRGKLRPVRGTIGKILRRATGGASDVPLNVSADVLATLSATVEPMLLPDWRIRANITSQVDVQKAEVPIAGIARVSVRSQVRSALEKKVQRYLDRLEKRVLNDDRLKKLAAREWERLHMVERLSEQPATWLVVRPTRAEATKISIGQHNVSLGLGIEAETRVLVAQDPPINPPAVLPPLGHAEAREGVLELNTLGTAPWQQLNAAISYQLARDSVQGSDGTVLYVEGATLAPWGDGLLLTIDLEAERGQFYKAGGRLYLTARPRLDVQQQRLFLEELDFSLETKDALTNMAAWLMQPTILEALQTKATLDMSAYIARARNKAKRAIERFVADVPQGIELSARLQELAITGLRVTQDALQVTASVSIQVDASVSRLTFPPASD